MSATIPHTLNIAPNTVRYQVADPDQRARLATLGVSVEFDALSVGSSSGTAALVPLDESSPAIAQRLMLAWNACAGMTDNELRHCRPVPQAEQVVYGQLLESMTQVLGAVTNLDQYVDFATGVCCCGASMDGHEDPMECGHSPVDSGIYAFRGIQSEVHKLLGTIQALKAGQA